MSIRTNLMNGVKLALILAAGLAAVSSPAKAQDSPPGQGQEYLAIEAREMPPESRELIQIFAPSIRHSDAKVTAGKGGSRLLTLTSDSILNGRAVRKFNQGLLERGINVYGAAYYGDFAWDRTSSTRHHHYPPGGRGTGHHRDLRGNRQGSANQSPSHASHRLHQ